MYTLKSTTNKSNIHHLSCIALYVVHQKIINIIYTWIELALRFTATTQVEFLIIDMQTIPHTKKQATHTAALQRHVWVNQNAKIDTQRHITDKN